MTFGPADSQQVAYYQRLARDAQADADAPTGWADAPLEMHHEEIQALNARALNAESIETGVLVADLQTGLARALAEVEASRAQLAAVAAQVRPLGILYAALPEGLMARRCKIILDDLRAALEPGR